MKVNLIKEKTVRDYAQKHASSVPSFEEWIEKTENANWTNPVDIKDTFGSADLLGKRSNRVCFNVGGNNHRIICTYYFNEMIDTVTLFVKWIDSHAEYDKLCDKNEQYTVEKY